MAISMTERKRAFYFKETANSLVLQRKLRPRYFTETAMSCVEMLPQDSQSKTQLRGHTNCLQSAGPMRLRGVGQRAFGHQAFGPECGRSCKWSCGVFGQLLP